MIGMWGLELYGKILLGSVENHTYDRLVKRAAYSFSMLASA